MKRALLLLFALFAIPALAHATPIPIERPVSWTRQIAAIPGGFADSASARAIGTATPTVHDTSSAIDMRDFVFPDAGTGALLVVGDTLYYARIDIYPAATAPTVAADSIYLTIQVSSDGVRNWTSCTPTRLFDTTTDSALGQIVLEQASTNAFYVVIGQRHGAAGSGGLMFPVASTATAPTWQQLYGWPFIRLIVQSDRTGRYDAKVFGFAAK